MPVTYMSPGVYVEEVPTRTRPIPGVPTTITAFVGRTQRGPVNQPISVKTLVEFENQFGGLSPNLTLPSAVRDYFTNGGSHALIVRVDKPAASATQSPSAKIQLKNGPEIIAASPGSWGNNLQITVYPPTSLFPGIRRSIGRYNLIITDTAANYREVVRNVTSTEGPRQIGRVLATESVLARVSGSVPATTPSAGLFSVTTRVTDSEQLTPAEILGSESEKTGLYSLEKAEIFHLLCLPPDSSTADTAPEIWRAAMQYCHRRRAILLADPPAAWSSTAKAIAGIASLGLTGPASRNAAVFYPRMRRSDPLQKLPFQTSLPSGAIAGVISRHDRLWGVWKPTAGPAANLVGIGGLTTAVSDQDVRELAAHGINSLRSLNGTEPVIYGERTLIVQDHPEDDYRSLAVGRLTMHIADSVEYETRWIVNVPNGEQTWKMIRQSVTALMTDLWRKGALQGSSAEESFTVWCDRQTTTPQDVKSGLINVLLAFAPMKPNNFLFIKLQLTTNPSSP